FVLGTERHESRRIDNQLRGRAGRQGDPGITIFYMSLEDDLIERFGGDQIRERKEKLVKEGKEFERLGHNRTFNHVVTNAQKKVEGNNYDQRKNTLRYDDVINEQRKDIYAQRQETINAEGDTLNKVMLAIFNRTIKRTV
ncbi:prepilin peptidase, partial [Lactobacillus crispatus]